jgi:hypothetical protein
LLYSKEVSNNGEIEGKSRDIVLNINDLRSKDVKEWSVE